MGLKDVIKRLCKEKGTTLAQVEQELGFSKGYLSKIDQSSPSTDRIRMLAKYFDVNPYELIYADVAGKEFDIKEGYYTERDAAKAAQEAFDNPDMKALFDAARGASAEDIRAACAVLLALKAKNGGNNQE